MLFASYTGGSGGAERLLIDQALALDAPVAVACPEGELAERARREGFRVAPLLDRPIRARGSAAERVVAAARVVAQSREVRRTIGELDPRCVVAWSMRALLSTTAALTSLRAPPPLVFQQNDLLPSRTVGAAVRTAARRADRVLVPSRAVAADLAGGAHLSVEVIHPGVDLNAFSPSPIPSGRPAALVLGAIVKGKRLDVALEAMALARRELPELRLCVAGAPIDGSGERLMARLRARAAERDLAGAVSFQGQVDDVPRALAEATCVLHCGEREAFGISLVEALAAGRPVVAPRGGGPQEIVDATCGRLFEPGDPVDAAAALVDVTSRAGELAAPARSRAARLFDLERSRARFRDVIDEVSP